jgi:hypothetical protein
MDPPQLVNLSIFIQLDHHDTALVRKIGVLPIIRVLNRYETNEKTFHISIIVQMCSYGIIGTWMTQLQAVEVLRQSLCVIFPAFSKLGRLVARY